MPLTCDDYQTGTRKRAICDGAIDMPLNKINAFRAAGGWGPLAEKPETTFLIQPKPKVTVRASSPPSGHSRPDTSSAFPRIKQPGTRLKEAFAKWNAEECPICSGLATQMDQWGVDGCRENLDYLVKSIAERGKDYFAEHFPKTNAMFTLSRSQAIRDLGIRLQIKSMIVTAIKATEAEEAELKKKFREPRRRRAAAAGVDFRISFRRKAQIRTEELSRQHSLIWTPGATEATAEKQAERLLICGGCPLMKKGRCTVEPSCDIVLKAKAADTFCPAGKWHKQTEFYRPLVNPTRNLIWHIWPKIGKEWNWHRHIEKIKAGAPLFNGRIAIGINYGDQLASVDEVKKLLSGVPVTDWVTAKADPNLGETTTFTDLLRCVQTDDPNAVTFRGHCKGVSHRKTGIEQPWSDLMWATCMDLPSVDEALSSHIMAGPLKCQEPLVSHQRYRWFYAGTFFWFRNREIFQRDWSEMEQTRWYPEAWPGVICKNEESACLCHDFTDGSVLRENYWNMVVAPSFEQWKQVRPNRDRRFE